MKGEIIVKFRPPNNDSSERKIMFSSFTPSFSFSFKALTISLVARKGEKFTSSLQTFRPAKKENYNQREICKTKFNT